MTQSVERMGGRAVWQVTGADALPFLQGLVTNDVLPLGKGDGIVWAALLTPQGKYLADFFVAGSAGRLLIDIDARLADATLRRLTMYRLRADVQITPADLSVARSLSPFPGSLPDPRHPALGHRGWGVAAGDPVTDWDAIRVAEGVPEYPHDLIPDDTYPLEMGFERLHGVDFRKGCYVGQEVTARMKHKTDLRKGLARVRLAAPVAAGTEVLAGDKPAGRIGTVAGLQALAWLRFDRMAGMTADGVAVTPAG
jgi:folate-binding protein YgfZ